MKVGSMKTPRDILLQRHASVDPKLDAIRQAIHDQQADRVYRAAHKLKGSAGNFDAHEVMALLQRLEARARDGNLATCVSVFVEIEAEAERLMTALELATVSGEVCAS